MAYARDELVLRPAEVGDAEQLAAILIEGFETYREFAPPGWAGPPEVDGIAPELARRLAQPSVWGMVGEHPSGLAGYVTLLPASESRRPVDDPALMHFWMLFVRSPWWGSGLATRLHKEACAAAAARGFAALRLFTPARQVRARRFYEREGWTVAEPPYSDPDLGLEIVEYRRALTPLPR
jgi:GNAT superfamily N-acetyltransferase